MFPYHFGTYSSAGQQGPRPTPRCRPCAPACSATTEGVPPIIPGAAAGASRKASASRGRASGTAAGATSMSGPSSPRIRRRRSRAHQPGTGGHRRKPGAARNGLEQPRLRPGSRRQRRTQRMLRAQAVEHASAGAGGPDDARPRQRLAPPRLGHAGAAENARGRELVAVPRRSPHQPEPGFGAAAARHIRSATYCLTRVARYPRPGDAEVQLPCQHAADNWPERP